MDTLGTDNVVVAGVVTKVHLHVGFELGVRTIAVDVNELNMTL